MKKKKVELPQALRLIAIEWLENNQRYGSFKGKKEADMNFKELDDVAVRWYLDNWIFSKARDRHKRVMPDE